MMILIVEDQTMIRELLALACSQARPLDEIHEAGTGSAALKACRCQPPCLVILDLGLPDQDALSLLDEILGVAPLAKIVAVAARMDEFTLHRALRSRAHAVIEKSEPLKVLHQAIVSVLQGRRFVSATVQRLHASVRADPSAFDKILSEREQEVLRLAGDGLSNGQIAAVLGISLSTSKHHRANVMSKLNIHSTRELIHYAIGKGFFSRKTECVAG
jgi:DNA-binding NarL/FixJ family response regulator